MGSSFALALKETGNHVVVGSDRDPRVVQKALDRGIVSSAAFLLSIGYVLALSHQGDWLEASKVASSGFRDMSRLAAGDPELYAGIAETNRENMVAMLDVISAELARLRRHLEADDPRLVELFEEARSVRERWARDNA